MEHYPEKMRPVFKPVVTECWGAVYRENEFTRPHDHWPAIWSFVIMCRHQKLPPIVFPGQNYQLNPKRHDDSISWLGRTLCSKTENPSERIMIAGNMSQQLNLSDNLD